MISIVPPEDGWSSGPPKKITLNKPVIVKDVAEKLAIRPFELIAHLMECNHFASIQMELSEEMLGQIGERFNVEFITQK